MEFLVGVEVLDVVGVVLLVCRIGVAIFVGVGVFILLVLLIFVGVGVYFVIISVVCFENLSCGVICC